MVLQSIIENARRTPPGPADKPGDFSLMAKKSAARRVLVVDDEPLVRWSLAETLMDGGFDVVEAADGRSAIQMFAHTEHPADVVLLDLRLPDSSDLTVLSAMRRLSPKTPIILMTAFGTPDIVDQALQIGAFSVVLKPFDMNDVGPLVSRALSTRPC
jgi:DNA-binding NtrC family response regulator